MAEAIQFGSNDYHESVRLLWILHLLTLAGKDQGPDGDAIRDAMEEPWRRLNDAERQRIEELSAELYLSGEAHVAPDSDYKPKQSI